MYISSKFAFQYWNKYVIVIVTFGWISYWSWYKQKNTILQKTNLENSTSLPKNKKIVSATDIPLAVPRLFYNVKNNI